MCQTFLDILHGLITATYALNFKSQLTPQGHREGVGVLLVQVNLLAGQRKNKRGGQTVDLQPDPQKQTN